MSSVLSAQPVASLVDMDRSSDPVNAPSQSFPHDSPSASSSSSSPNNSHENPSKTSPPRSPTSRPAKLEQNSPPPESNANALVNGHSPNHTEEQHQVPSQAPPQEKLDPENIERGKEDPEWEDQSIQLGSDAEEDPDYEAGENDVDWTQDETEADMRRVKVYELIDQKWTDRGTAFCQGDYIDHQREAKLVARAEHTNEILLECTIRTSDVYQRQQDTLIVWTEPDGTDYALSFQDIEGCAEVWDFIMDVQKHLKDKGVYNIRAAIAGLAKLTAAPLSSSPPIDDESNTSEGSTSMHMLSSGPMSSFSVFPKFPAPALGQMPECERAIRQHSRLPHGKEKLCDVIMQMDYVKLIVDVMRQAEDLEDIKELHACCSCMQAILMLNDHNLLDYVLQDHIFYGMVGVLEYDPEFPTHKAFYREFLENFTQFRQPIPIREPQTRQKIEQTYRLQFLKDVVLARATDDATFNVLNSCIIFNQIDIVNQVQQDERFLREIVGLFLTTDQGEMAREKREDDSKVKGKQKARDDDAMEIVQEPKTNGMHKDGPLPSSPEIGPAPAQPPKPTSGASPVGEYTIDDRRKDTILLIQQLCVMGKNVQLPSRLQLFRTLVDRGILHAIQWAIGRPERQMVSTGGEVLTVLLDHDVNGVRQHVMKQVGVSAKPTMGMSVGVAGQTGDATGAEGRRETLLETLCRLLTTSTELAYKSQMADAVRAVLEVPQADNTDTNNMAALRAIARAKDDPVTERFLEYFYQKCCEGLFRPVSELPDHRRITEPTLPLSRERSNLYLYLCDLLSSFAVQHSYRSHFFIVSSSTTKPSLVPRIASLLRAREKHLRLGESFTQCLSVKALNENGQAALRFFRACLKLGNRNMTSHLVHCDVLVRILELTARESKWDNLLSSCCQEFFEHIRRENIKDLLSHMMTKYEAKIQELALSPVCGLRFQGLIRRWEMNNEPPPKEPDNPQATSTPARSRWGQGRMPEAEEEDYFNNSDDEHTPNTSAGSPLAVAPPLGTGVGLLSGLKRKRARSFSALAAAPAPKQPRKMTATIVPPRLPLVDYEEDDEEPADAGGRGSTSTREMSPEPASTKPAAVDWFSTARDAAGSALPDTGSARGMVRLGSPPRLGEKRRRADEDEEDELLARLVRTNKRQQTAAPSLLEGKAADPPKPKPGQGTGKMKLKLGTTSFSLGSSAPPPPPGETKDGG